MPGNTTISKVQNTSVVQAKKAALAGSSKNLGSKTFALANNSGPSSNLLKSATSQFSQGREPSQTSLFSAIVPQQVNFLEEVPFRGIGKFGYAPEAAIITTYFRSKTVADLQNSLKKIFVTEPNDNFFSLTILNEAIQFSSEM